MTLEKKRVLAKMEFSFTEGKIHQDCHCVYHDVIYEDGVQIAVREIREVSNSDNASTMIQQADKFIPKAPL